MEGRPALSATAIPSGAMSQRTAVHPARFTSNASPATRSSSKGTMASSARSVPATSTVRAERWTKPTSTDTSWYRYRPGTDSSKSHRGAVVKTSKRTP